MSNVILDSFLSQGNAYRVLFRQLENRSSVHAYLITGEKGTGKKTLAALMCEALLCSSDTGRPCGVCKNCVLCEAGEHPDLIRIEKGNPIAPGIRKDRATIPVEDIREMIRLCGVRSPSGNMHAVLGLYHHRRTRCTCCHPAPKKQKRKVIPILIDMILTVTVRIISILNYERRSSCQK